MPRFKQFKGNKTPTSKQLRKQLTTKRDSVKDDVNQSLIVKSGPGPSSAVNSPHVARKSISHSNQSIVTPHFARKSFGNANEDRYIARKRVTNSAGIENKSANKKSAENCRSNTRNHGDDNDESIPSTSSANVPSHDTPVKKIRKSGTHMRPYAVPRIHQRRKPGVLALQQIRYYQKQTGLLIPKTNFQRVVREVLRDYSTIDYRIQREALVALQEAAEIYLVQKFEAGQLCAIHANRVTLMNRDFTLLKYFDNNLNH